MLVLLAQAVLAYVYLATGLWGKVMTSCRMLKHKILSFHHCIVQSLKFLIPRLLGKVLADCLLIGSSFDHF